MELKEFVTATLVQITQGVQDAQEQVKESGALINPKTYGSTEGAIFSGVRNDRRNVQTVKMDIAVTVVEKAGKKAGAGIVASFIKVGLSNEESEANTSTNRIQFDIPIALPLMKE